jgi:hypothetical protein
LWDLGFYIYALDIDQEMYMRLYSCIWGSVDTGWISSRSMKHDLYTIVKAYVMCTRASNGADYELVAVALLAAVEQSVRSRSAHSSKIFLTENWAKEGRPAHVALAIVQSPVKGGP